MKITDLTNKKESISLKDLPIGEVFKINDTLNTQDNYYIKITGPLCYTTTNIKKDVYEHIQNIGCYDISDKSYIKLPENYMITPYNSELIIKGGVF